MVDEGFNILSVEPVVMKAIACSASRRKTPLRIREERRPPDRGSHGAPPRGPGLLVLPLQHGPLERPVRRQAPSGCGAGQGGTLPSRRTVDFYPCHQFVGREGYKLGDYLRGHHEHGASQYFRERAMCSTSRSAATAGRASSARAAAMPMPTSSTATSVSLTKSAARSRKALECAILVQALLALEKMEKEEQKY